MSPIELSWTAKNIKMSIKHKDDKSDIGQPWCGESVRIVKLSHLGLVEVPHNPVHVILILREDFPFPQKH